MFSLVFGKSTLLSGSCNFQAIANQIFDFQFENKNKIKLTTQALDANLEQNNNSKKCLIKTKTIVIIESRHKMAGCDKYFTTVQNQIFSLADIILFLRVVKRIP